MRKRDRTSSFRAALKHAFAIPEKEPLSAQQELWLERIADRVVRRGLATPAAFLLLSTKPMNFVASQLLVFFTPIISAVVPPQQCDEAADLLSRRSAVETLLRMIEERQERDTAS